MIDFPASPVIGQKFTAAGVTWTWDGAKWGLTAAAGAPITIGDTPPSSPVIGALWYDSVGGQMYVWYNDGTSSQWVPVVNQGASAVAQTPSNIVAPPPAASWTQRNFNASVSAVDAANGIYLSDANIYNATLAARVLSRTSPATPYVVDALLNMSSYYGNGAGVGIGWTDGTKYMISHYGTSTATPNGAAAYRIIQMATSGTYTSDGYGPIGEYYDPSGIWLRIADDGTNISVSTSRDGVNWIQRFTSTRAAAFLGASGFTNVMFGVVGGTANGGPYGAVTAPITATLKSWWVH